MEPRETNFKNFALYSGVSKEEYNQIKPLVAEANLKTWKVNSIVLEILFILLFIVSILYVPFQGFAPYFGVLSVFTIILVLVLLVGLKSTSKALLPILYTSISVILGVILACCIFVQTSYSLGSSMVFCAILITVSFFLIDKPYRVVILLTVFGILFIVGTIIRDAIQIGSLKDADAITLANAQLWHDLILSSLFSVAAVVFAVFNNYRSIRRLASLYLTQKERDTDALTGVKNAIAYDRAIEELNNKIKHKVDFKFAIAVFDINGLKSMNDTFGHNHGDDLIIRASKLICNAFKHSPVYRIGGDEFVTIITDEDYVNKEKICRELKERIEEIHLSAASPLEDTSIAFGVSVYSKQNDYDYVTIFSRADADMYNNKRLIKNKDQQLENIK